MQLAIGKADFARALASTARTIENRNTIAILSHVRIEASNDNIRVTGTDLDIVATDTAQADVSQPGAVCVDAKLLSGIVNKAAGDIKAELVDDKLVLKSGRSRFSLATLPAADFPDLPEGDYAATFDIDLAAAVAPCVHAISNEETRYFLNGVFLRGGENGVAVATDGHRLSKNALAGLPDFEGVIVPKKLIGLLPKGGCKVSVSQDKIRVEHSGAVMTSKLIDGTFPDFERVIPRDNPQSFSVDRDDIMRASERVVSVSSEKGRAVKLSVAPGAVMLSARSDVGAAEDEVAADYTGEPIDIGFNSQYLRDMLASLPSGKVVFNIGEGLPGVLRHDSAPDWTGVIMPMRIGW